jgi:hypothetical protein
LWAQQNPTMVTVSLSTNLQSKSSCIVDTWVGYADTTTGVPQGSQNWAVTYVLVNGPGPAPPSATTNQHGFVVHQTVPWKTTIVAKVDLASALVHLVSAPFTCRDGGKKTK